MVLLIFLLAYKVFLSACASQRLTPFCNFYYLLWRSKALSVFCLSSCFMVCTLWYAMICLPLPLCLESEVAAGDFPLSLRILRNGLPVYIPCSYCMYRMHGYRCNIYAFLIKRYIITGSMQESHVSACCLVI